MRLIECYDSVLAKLDSIRGNSREISKFSFFEFGKIEELDIYLLGLQFHYGVNITLDLDIALNCYQYAHTGYEIDSYDHAGIYFERIQSPTGGSSLRDHIILNRSMKKAHPVFLTDEDFGDLYEVEQLCLLSAAAIKYDQKWASPFLGEINVMVEPKSFDEDMDDVSSYFFPSRFNALLSRAKRACGK